VTDAHKPLMDWLERANQLAIAAQLLPNAVHDVNNALQVITGNAELLDLAAGADEEVRRRGLAIRSQASRATMILNELTAFTRHTTEQAQRVSVRAVVERGLALRRYSLTKLGIKSTVDGEEAALAHPRHLLQIVLNLLINGEQALAGQPGGRIDIRVARSGEQVLVTTSDNGQGVSADAEARLFRPGDTLSEATGRLGIGLSASRSLAERQGGALSFARGSDGGGVFTLTLRASSACS
jgi:C4-dicarboxylate-specific signal transduction histidine kinase